jgi:short-subunit dehydrogenase
MQGPDSKNLAVLITGASSGIGKACALHLDRQGFKVIATVRKEQDAQVLLREASPKLKVVFMDVCDNASIQTAVTAVASLAGNRLFGLINNAGVAFGGPLEIMPFENMRRLLDVNINGVLAVTRAFLPLLRAGRGRIINMGSIAGLLAPPYLSVYAASKFALKGLSDALRLELRPMGIAVSLLEIGIVETPIWEKGLSTANTMMESADTDVCRLYGPLFDFSNLVVCKAPRIGAEKVARSAERALRARNPRSCYLVGMDAYVFKILSALPRRLRDRLFLHIMPRYGQP